MCAIIAVWNSTSEIYLQLSCWDFLQQLRKLVLLYYHYKKADKPHLPVPGKTLLTHPVDEIFFFLKF